MRVGAPLKKGVGSKAHSSKTGDGSVGRRERRKGRDVESTAEDGVLVFGAKRARQRIVSVVGRDDANIERGASSICVECSVR